MKFSSVFILASIGAFYTLAAPLTVDQLQVNTDPTVKVGTDGVVGNLIGGVNLKNKNIPLNAPTKAVISGGNNSNVSTSVSDIQKIANNINAGAYSDDNIITSILNIILGDNGILSKLLSSLLGGKANVTSNFLNLSNVLSTSSTSVSTGNTVKSSTNGSTGNLLNGVLGSNGSTIKNLTFNNNNVAGVAQVNTGNINAQVNPTILRRDLVDGLLGGVLNNGGLVAGDTNASNNNVAGVAQVNTGNINAQVNPVIGGGSTQRSINISNAGAAGSVDNSDLLGGLLDGVTGGLLGGGAGGLLGGAGSSSTNTSPPTVKVGSNGVASNVNTDGNGLLDGTLNGALANGVHVDLANVVGNGSNAVKLTRRGLEQLIIGALGNGANLQTNNALDGLAGANPFDLGSTINGLGLGSGVATNPSLLKTLNPGKNLGAQVGNAVAGLQGALKQIPVDLDVGKVARELPVVGPLVDSILKAVLGDFKLDISAFVTLLATLTDPTSSDGDLLKQIIGNLNLILRVFGDIKLKAVPNADGSGLVPKLVGSIDSRVPLNIPAILRI